MKDCSYIGEKQIEIIERISMDIYIYIYGSRSGGRIFRFN